MINDEGDEPVVDAVRLKIITTFGHSSGVLVNQTEKERCDTVGNSKREVLVPLLAAEILILPNQIRDVFKSLLLTDF